MGARCPAKTAKILPGKWVLDQKKDSEGNLVRNRARWVVCGNFEQNWQYQDLYAAVANNTSVKVFLLLTAVLDLECEQVDVVRAFLNAALEEGDEIYVAQPDGFDDGTGRVCRLSQALYGLRKAPLLWFRVLSTALKKLGFEALTTDLCVFKHHTETILLIIYVDDMLISAPTRDLVASVRHALKEHFELKELGDVKHFLGIKIVRNRASRQIFMSQELFSRKILQDLCLDAQLHALKTPMDAKWQPPTHQYEQASSSAVAF